MPKASVVTLEKVSMAFPQKFDWVCECHIQDYPPFTGEIHGMSQALMSRHIKQRLFWWMVVLFCVTCGTAMVVLVIIEYLQVPTASSTTIKLANSLELPAITVCPKTPDSLNFTLLFDDIKHMIPNITTSLAKDLIKYWLAGSGLENMNAVSTYNLTYLTYLDTLYKKWSHGNTHQGFFDAMQEKYGYKCEDLFASCVLGGKTLDCCNVMFKRQVVPRRGICYQTRRNVNQTEADDIGRLVLHIKPTSRATSPLDDDTQSQMIVYVTDNFEYVTDFPRYYLYPFQWNRMHFTARYISLLPSKDCTTKIFGRDTECFLKNWVFSNIFLPYNCTVPYLNPPYLTGIKEIPPGTPVCEPLILASNYYERIEMMNSGMYGFTSNDCIPGCNRWDYSTTMQQGDVIETFEGYTFNFEASFYELQYEYLQEVQTTTIPGFMSQIGGQFGFFLGLSIITMIQVIIFLANKAIKFCQNFYGQRKSKTYPVDENINSNKKFED